MAGLGARITDALKVFRGEAGIHQWRVVLLFEDLGDNSPLGITVAREGSSEYVTEFGISNVDQVPYFALGVVRHGSQITVGLRARNGYNFVVNGHVEEGHSLTAGEEIKFYDNLRFRFLGLVDETGLRCVKAP